MLRAASASWSALELMRVTLITLLIATIRFFFDRDIRNARSVFMISNLYLLTVMLLLVVDARS